MRKTDDFLGVESNLQELIEAESNRRGELLTHEAIAFGCDVSLQTIRNWKVLRYGKGNFVMVARLCWMLRCFPWQLTTGLNVAYSPVWEQKGDRHVATLGQMIHVDVIPDGKKWQYIICGCENEICSERAYKSLKLAKEMAAIAASELLRKMLADLIGNIDPLEAALPLIKI